MINRKQEQQHRDYVINATSLLADSVAWIRDHLSPEDVFNDAELEAWALDNGYVLEDEDDE